MAKVGQANPQPSIVSVSAMHTGVGQFMPLSSNCSAVPALIHHSQNQSRLGQQVFCWVIRCIWQHPDRR